MMREFDTVEGAAALVGRDDFGQRMATRRGAPALSAVGPRGAHSGPSLRLRPCLPATVADGRTYVPRKEQEWRPERCCVTQCC